jgi:hypothetical protein
MLIWLWHESGSEKERRGQERQQKSKFNMCQQIPFQHTKISSIAALVLYHMSREDSRSGLHGGLWTSLPHSSSPSDAPSQHRNPGRDSDVLTLITGSLCHAHVTKRALFGSLNLLLTLGESEEPTITLSRLLCTPSHHHLQIMGFFRRIFSFGRKKKQKTTSGAPQPNPTVTTEKIQSTSNAELEHEAEIGRLLRSSSARYEVIAETDPTSLPPLRKYSPRELQHVA